MYLRGEGVITHLVSYLGFFTASWKIPSWFQDPLEQDPNWDLTLELGLRAEGGRAWKTEADTLSLGYVGCIGGQERQWSQKSSCSASGSTTPPTLKKVQGTTYWPISDSFPLDLMDSGTGVGIRAWGKGGKEKNLKPWSESSWGRLSSTAIQATWICTAQHRIQYLLPSFGLERFFFPSRSQMKETVRKLTAHSKRGVEN